jgi:hypothetical protein
MVLAGELFCQGYGSLRDLIECLIEGTSQREFHLPQDRPVQR